MSFRYCECKCSVHQLARFVYTISALICLAVALVQQGRQHYIGTVPPQINPFSRARKTSLEPPLATSCCSRVACGLAAASCCIHRIPVHCFLLSSLHQLPCKSFTAWRMGFPVGCCSCASQSEALSIQTCTRRHHQSTVRQAAGMLNMRNT